MMAENLPGICWVGDRDAKPLWGNSRWHAMYDDTAAAHGDARGAIHPDDLPRARAIWHEMRTEGSPGEFRLRLRGRDGVYRPFLSKASPIHDATGIVTRWVAVQIDLSDQQAQDRRQMVLRSFADAARDVRQPDAILSLLAGILTEQLGVEQLIFAEQADDDQSGLRVFRAIDGVPVSRAEPLLTEAFNAFAALDRPAETFVVRDHDVDLAPTSPIRIAATAMGMRSGINVPLVRKGRQVAGFSCLNRGPRDWTADDIALCEELADRTWALVARARAEMALQARERGQAFLIGWTDRLRELADADADAIIGVTMAALGAYFGVSRVTYSIADNEGRTFAVCGEWMNGVQSIAHTSFSLDWAAEDQQRAWLDGQPLRIDDVAEDPRIAGAIRKVYAGADIRAFLTIPLIEHGVARSALSLQQDSPRHWTENDVLLLREVADRTWVSIERARAEADLRERERTQAFLINWVDRVRGLTSTDAITATTLAAIGGFLGVARSTYAIADEAGVNFTICGEWLDHGPSIAGSAFTFEATGPVLTEDWHSGDIIQSSDVEVDPAIAPAMLQPYRETGIRAFVSVPLLEGGRVRSSLSVQHDAPRAWTDRQLALLRDVAERTWVALERARAETELQERERGQAFLIDWADRVRDEASPDRIVEITLARLGKHFGVNRATYSLGDETGNLLSNRGEWIDGVISVADMVWRLDDVDPEVRQQWLSGEAVHYDDIPNDPRIPMARREFFESVAVRSLITIPLIEQGRVRSALSLQSRTARTWTQSEIQLLSDVAERTWVVLERARAEAELATRERNQAFLIDWTDRVRSEIAPARIVAVTLDAVGRFLGAARVTFAQADGDVFEVTGEWRERVASLLGNRFALPSVGAVVDREWHAGESVCFDDVETDPRLEPAAVDRYLANQIRAFISVPLIAGGAMQSALSVQSDVARPWTETEMQLLRDVAERTWVALERAEAQAALAERGRHQAFMVAWGDVVRGETSARTILARTVRMLAEHMAVARVNYAEPDADFATMTGSRKRTIPAWWASKARPSRSTISARALPPTSAAASR